MTHSRHHTDHDLDNFDPDWYVTTYPDVAASGLDPREHFEWIGRRLNRRGFSASAREMDSGSGHVSPVTPAIGSALEINVPNGNSEVERAVEQLGAWLLPPAKFEASDRDAFRSKVIYDFLHSIDSNLIVTENKNGRTLVQLMSGMRQADTQIVDKFYEQRFKHAKSIVLVSYYTPSKFHAGGLRILDMYSEMRKRYPELRLVLLAVKHPDINEDEAMLATVFNEVHFCDASRFGPIWIRQTLENLPSFDVADLQFHQAGNLAGAVRPFASKVLFTPMEALARFDFDILQTDLGLKKDLDKSRLFSLIHNALLERSLMQTADMTVCVSDADAAFLANCAPQALVGHIPTGISNIEFGSQLAKEFDPEPMQKRPNRLVFAAYFGSETNIRGLEWYLKCVHHRVRNECPDYTLAVVGRGDTSTLEALSDDAVHFIGEVPNLGPVIEQAKAGLVLAVFGSGFRGKINQYAICGVPSVSTALGVTGLSYKDGVDIAICDDPENFAAACIRILKDDSFAQLLADKARQRVLREYSWAGLWPSIAQIYELEGAQ